MANGRIAALHDGLNQHGFERISSRVGHLYRGLLKNNGPGIPVEISLVDLDFVQLPVIRLTDRDAVPERALPHIFGPTGVVCYYQRGSIVLDRYDPTGTALQCLYKAEKVIRQAIAGKLDDDFVAEFEGYWTETFMLSDVPPSFTGAGSISFVRLNTEDKRTPVLTAGRSWWTDLDPSSQAKSEIERALIVSIDRAVSVDPNRAWPPATLDQVIAWLEWLNPRLVTRLDEAIIDGSPTVALAIKATNGMFAVRFGLPKQLQTREFLNSRRRSIPKVLRTMASTVRVERISTDAADLDYVYSRNLGRTRNLSGKKLLMIGCGTIGSFLAHQMAMCGAGVGGGEFHLIDNDKLKTANLGRHLLGVPHLHRNKAEACAEFLNGMLPGANVEGFDVSRYDAVIDVTGEEAFSIALNQRAIDRRPKGPTHFYGWLAGNGAIAQCLMVDGSEANACLKCLKPTLAGRSRFPTLKPGVSVEIGAVQACSDTGFVTFPVSRSISAAALVCDLVLDWANGNQRDRLRSRTFNPRQAFEIKDQSPTPSKDCPACTVAR
ncbi:E2/UBC family protein [Mesorhizobium sp. YIM 152430]|uniref:E2/UBC family protein n=1 Tax=Mesorhizobium sp. YIM 152430 TaxID=3031761 RepID=UPI0023DA46C5|nr:E2/UBC family protein [Mesorhizobium sp. YIM 152430]MDF1600925.1 E2/UBC family protein [Mesorhizobium sp. YIM 152430]